MGITVFNRIEKSEEMNQRRQQCDDSDDQNSRWRNIDAIPGKFGHSDTTKFGKKPVAKYHAGNKDTYTA
jgi:hypothetical protein